MTQLSYVLYFPCISFFLATGWLNELTFSRSQNTVYKYSIKILMFYDPKSPNNMQPVIFSGGRRDS
jgi:hypothetical protein